ncbi:SusC/RagA family TonB-linked outer membrane protein [Candidatus Sulfidibacterium hydrothermale]|uniref:SusC/RagA family TonB-linked outer membrane protein n=1 Tax=Candidatus Sulfidibacterium hydrothermale TaxID=2875962 RepID=UPI001F0A0FA4|nr:SusC/RagA family TonB-linked outer membrane protein [Candidatus Sulfidibacterium hydrothermale]UBM61984.1 SusC/RagA family TonB-linked outer membrane protein [Candidatus Sulfidibacterium hydrothermale]
MKKVYRFLFLTIMFISASQLLLAQTQVVKGVVKDNTGVGLPGVNIRVKGTTIGTTTDLDGKYKIHAANGSILVFSFVGYDTKEVKVTGPTLNVVLQESVKKLNEVVVTAFGIKKETRALGYSVTQIKPKDVDIAGQTDAVAALQGKVPGLQISQTGGSAGGGVDILIRGITSIDPGRSNQPLIIVDGMPIDNSTFAGNVLPSAGSNATGSNEQFDFASRVGDLNPDDIASYSVLKGAAATALYGVRAANGAIVITTKKGKKGAPKINLTMNTTFRKVVKTPSLQETYREGNRTTKIPGAVIDPDAPGGYLRPGSFAFYSWGVPFSQDWFIMPSGDSIDLRHDAFHDPYELFKTGINTQLNFNISGASDRFNYFFSSNWTTDNGVLPNTYYDKKTFRVNAGYKLLKNLQFNTSISYTKTFSKQANSGDKSVFSSLSYWSATFPINDYEYPDGTEKNYTNGIIDNPRYFLEKSNLQSHLNRWIANINVNWQPYKWMSATYSFQVDNYSDRRNRFVPPDLDVGSQVHGFIVDENIFYTGLESDLLLHFNHNWTKDFNTSLTLGNQVSDRQRNYYYIRGEGLNVPGINDLSNTINTFAGASVTDERNVGVFYSLQLGYKNKLFVNTTGRNDWVSTMPEGNRSFFYPSVSGSYVFTEDFFKNSKVFTFGKIRISWAQVGKGPRFGQIGHYYIPDPDFPFGAAGGYRASTTSGDLNIKPERDNSFEVGTNLHFFRNRLRVDYSYYTTNVKDQIFTVGTAYSSGLSGVVRNAGDYKTWGHEVMVSGDVIRNNNIKWEIYVNWSTNKGRVEALPPDLDEIVFFSDRITSKAKVGDEIGSLYGWVFKTVDGQRYVISSGSSAGKWMITGDKNDGYFYTNGNQMVKVGNAFPDFVASVGSNFTWKNLSFNFLIEWKNGGDVYDKGYRNALRNGNLLETEFRDQERVLEGVTDDGNGGYKPNDIPLEITANSYYRDWNNYNNAAEVLLKDASWVKLRTIGITYRFHLNHIRSFDVFANAHNIIIWTPFDGFDPEANYFGAATNIYGYTGLTVPLSQSYTFGIKFQF